MDCSKTCANFKKKETPYTEEAARKEVGSSTDYLAGLAASIKKWEQIVAGNYYSYTKKSPCGLCFVQANRGNKEPFPCTGCPALPICKRIDANAPPTEILGKLEKLKEKLESPFDGVKTADLKVGMVVRRHNIGYGEGETLIVLEKPGKEKVKVLKALKGYSPQEQSIYLGDVGCQPYYTGIWNKCNWLEEL